MRSRIGQAWAILVALGGVAVLGFGGVHAPVRAFLHLLLVVAIAATLRLPTPALHRAGAARAWVVAGLFVTAALCTGFLPVPESVRPWIADDARVGWTPLSLDAERTFTSLCLAWWLAGLGITVSVVTSADGRRGAFERWPIVAVGVVTAVGAAHWFGGVGSLFGIVPVSRFGDAVPFAAPFIDRNHFGSFLLLGLPTVVARAMDGSVARAERTAAAVLVLAAFVTMASVRSTAPLGLAAFQLVALAAVAGRGSVVAVASSGALLSAGVVGWDVVVGGTRDLTLHGRIDVWTASLRLLREHWLAGAGAGTFVEAIQPFRTDVRFETWDHAHNDWLEALVETGLVGLPLWFGAAVALRPRPSKDRARSAPLELGVLGVLLHAFVEFPLEIPALAGGLVTAWATRNAVHATSAPVDARLVRGALVGAAALQVVGAAWMWRTASVEGAHRELEAGRSAGAIRTLSWLAPGSPELLLAQGDSARVAGNLPKAAELGRRVASGWPADASVQRSAAVLLARADDEEGAVAAARRAVELGGWDWRNHVVLGLLLAGGTDPDAEVAAWRAALGAGAPSKYFANAWRAVPIGVVWVDAIEHRPPQTHGALGAFLVRAGDLDAAELAFEQAGVNDSATFPEYVDLLVSRGRLADAEAYVIEALEQRPRDRELRRRRARVLEAMERWGEAAEAWEDLATEERAVKEAAVHAVRCAEHLGTAEALATAERLRLARVGGATLVLEEARVRWRAGDADGCISALLRSDHLEDPKVGPQLRKQLEICRRRSPTPRPGGEEDGEQGHEGHPVP